MPAAYEQQWLTLAKEYHDHLLDIRNVAEVAGSQQPAVRHNGSDADEWRVQIFRYAPSHSISTFNSKTQQQSCGMGRCSAASCPAPWW